MNNSCIITNKQNQNEILEKHDVYQILKTMAKKIENLEEEVKQLKKRSSNIYSNVLEILNSNYKPILDFTSWINQEIIVQIPHYLEDVFITDLITAIKKMFENYNLTARKICLPFCYTYKNREHKYFIYENSQWKIVEEKKLNYFIKFIMCEFTNVFNKTWCEENKENILKNDKYKDMFEEYQKKVLGGNVKPEILCNKIKDILKKNFVIKFK